LNEFSLIDNYFKCRNKSKTSQVKLSIGDDAAVVSCPPGHELVIATDTLVADVHFPATVGPADIGYKALAVNLSDLAAMGAEPSWALLNLTLPEFNDAWLNGFSDGLFELIDEYELNLAGGDTCRGPLNIGVTVAGWVPQNQALTRSGARVGDVVFVSGYLGDATMGLRLYCRDVASEISAEDKDYLLSRLHRPTPRVALGQRLLGLVTSCIDVSDGLMADAAHICEQSNVGMEIIIDNLPLSSAFKNASKDIDDLNLALAGGDDYELCFTCAKEQVGSIEKIAQGFDLPLAKIGMVNEQPDVRFIDANGDTWETPKKGYKHFD